jgi:CubicO group peptidase (beta-lactamase class C family)
MNLRLPLAICLFALLANLALSQSAADQIASQFMSRYHVPGLAYAILRDGEVVSHGTLGVVDTKTNQPVRDDSVFPIASLSKPFVALGVLTLAELHKLDLTDPVGKYLPDLPADWKTIQLIRLLDHTSGIPDHYNAGKWDVTGPDPISSDELISKLATLPLHFKAGDKYEYSNGNYALLAKVIEKVSGKPYDEYLEQAVFNPLGMYHTKALSRADLPNVVQGYSTQGDTVAPAAWNPDWCYGNCALGTTWKDLARLDAALYSEQIVKFSTLAFITTPQPLNDGSKPGYAMGWMIGNSRGQKTISHNGKISGWRSSFERFLQKNVTVVVLSSNGDPELGELSADLAGTEVPDLALWPIQDDDPNLTRLHRQFLEAIRDGQVQESWLSPGLSRDYETKDQWSGIRKMISDRGPITLFAVAKRTQTGGEMISRYRVEQGARVMELNIGQNSSGFVTSLMVMG